LLVKSPNAIGIEIKKEVVIEIHNGGVTTITTLTEMGIVVITVLSTISIETEIEGKIEIGIAIVILETEIVQKEMVFHSEIAPTLARLPTRAITTLATYRIKPRIQVQAVARDGSGCQSAQVM
jgi:hypothetical protein